MLSIGPVGARGERCPVGLAGPEGQAGARGQVAIVSPWISVFFYHSIIIYAKIISNHNPATSRSRWCPRRARTRWPRRTGRPGRSTWSRWITWTRWPDRRGRTTRRGRATGKWWTNWCVVVCLWIRDKLVLRFLLCNLVSSSWNALLQFIFILCFSLNCNI